jgi:predicted nucleic acid-binding protein
MIFADTGFFIALLNPRDELHARVQAWLTHVTEKVVVSEYVLWELVNFYSKPINRSKVHKLLTRLRTATQYEIVPATSEMFDAGLALHADRPDKEWSLTDCISFLIMKNRGLARALAYDLHFEQAGFEALLRRDPVQGSA